MNVRAKFRVTNITQPNWGGSKTTSIEMTPVYSDDPNHENKKFWDATPMGSIVLHINNEAAAKQFEPNGEYYVDFSKA